MSSPFGSFTVEDWFTKIKQFTFETAFIKLTIGDAESLCSAYESKKKGDKKKFTEEDQIRINNVLPT